VDWVPSLEGKSFADGKIGTDRADEELEKFRDYWCAMPGQRGTKLDWNRTWNNWVRNTGGRFNGNGRDKSLKEKYADALHKLGSSETSANVIGFLPKLHSD
jgi:hypothetical protein